MKSPDSEVTLAARAGTGTVYADKEADGETSSQRAGTARKEKKVSEKPQTLEEIVIEEISIDGMCGVY